MLTVAILTALLPLPAPTFAADGPPSPTFQGNRTRPVVFINGIDPINDESGTDLREEWQPYVEALRGWGWTGGFHMASYYECDKPYGDDVATWNLDDYGKAPDRHASHNVGRSQAENHQRDTQCGTLLWYSPYGSHDVNTEIEHIAYHFAWMVHSKFSGQCINVVAHSMGGLIARYALARFGSEDFPSQRPCIDDIVTLGTPHAGSTPAAFCSYYLAYYQCTEMVAGSPFITWMAQNAANPQGAGKTEWTVIGSEEDTVVNPASATAMSAADRVVYDEAIEHNSILDYRFGTGGGHYKNTTTGDITAKIRWESGGLYVNGPDATVGPWPARFTDMSLAYDGWGCTTEAAWPIRSGVKAIGEPYTTATDCWYRLDVPAGQGSLVVTMSSLNWRDLDLSVRHASATASPTCSKTTTEASHTCVINYPAAGRWFIKVDNSTKARARDPFQLVASYSTVVQSLSSTQITSRPNSVGGDQTYDVCWSVSGSGTISHTDLHWGTTTSLGNTTPVRTGTAPASYCETLVSPASGTIYVRAHASGLANDVWSSMSSIPVIVGNDCDTGADAGGTHSTAALITPPKNCTGYHLSSSDDMDWYKVYLSQGDTISASIVPSSGANFDLCLNNPSPYTVHCSANPGSATDSFTYTATSTGYWSIDTYISSGTGSYALSVVTSSSGASPNLLWNPGFETGSESSWSRYGEGWPGCSFGLSTAWRKSGSYSYRVGDTGSSPCGVYQEVPVTAGTQYVAAGTIYITSATRVQAYLQWWNGSGAISTEVLNVRETGEINVTTTGIAPSGATKARVYVYIASSDTGEVFADDLSLRVVRGTNILYNPSFESGSEWSWSRYGDGWPGCSFGISTNWHKGAGWYSYRVTDTSTSPCGVYQTVPVAAGEHYVATATFNTTSFTGRVQLYLQWWNESGAISTEVLNVKDTGELVGSVSGTAPPGATSARIYGYVPSGDTADMYVDDVRLQRV